MERKATTAKSITKPISRWVIVLEMPFALNTASPRGVVKKYSVPRAGSEIAKLVI